AISGNTIQLPVHVPVNVCGNTVNVVGLLNPAAGNTCANEGGGRSGARGAVSGTGAEVPGGPYGPGARKPGGPRGGAVAHGGGTDAAGVLSGNGVRLPVDLPVNVTGNSVNVVGIGNAAVGNESANVSEGGPGRPGRPVRPVAPTPRPPAPPVEAPAPQGEPAHPTPPRHLAALAETGADPALPAVAASAALILAGAVLYRRSRAAAPR
ncbi:chaplin, partial [Streptomyces sp. NPDC057757]